MSAEREPATGFRSVKVTVEVDKIYFRGGSLTKVKSRRKGMCESEPKMRTVHRGGMRVKESYGGSLAVVVVIIVEIEKKKPVYFHENDPEDRGGRGGGGQFS